MLVDDFGRELSGIRVSLTDRCNFDCVYCHNEGLGDTRGPMEPQDNEMETDEVVRLLEVAAEFDIQKVKFTGGEPMLRQDLEEIVRRCPDEIGVSLTTNGTFLPDRAADLVDAGVERVNVSQDAVDPEAFAEVTKSGAYDKVMEGVDAAVAAGLTPVKLNMVVFEATAGYVPEMVDRVAANEGLRLQLIEYMPEIAGNPEWAIDIQRVHDWLEDQADHVETREMHDRKRYWVSDGSNDSGADANVAIDGSAPREGEDANAAIDGSAPRESEDANAAIDGSAGMIEIVDPVENEDFCANCHRVRVTHEGALKGCLNRPRVHPMGEMTKPEIRAAFHDVVEDRVPYYGEYMVEDEDGEWVINDDYVGEPAVADGPMAADDD